MSESATALLALWNDVDPSLDDAYNQWHAQEHVPERCTVPGILWGRRYAQTQAAELPRYLTLYGLRDAQVLDGEAYQRLLREPTPASRAMRPALCNLSRWVCRLQRGSRLAPDADLEVITLADSAQVRAALDLRANGSGAGSGDGLLAERILDAAPLPWLDVAQGRVPRRAIEGAWLLCLPVDPVQPITSGQSVWKYLPSGLSMRS